MFQAGQVWRAAAGLREPEEGEGRDGWVPLSGAGDEQRGHGASGPGNQLIQLTCVWAR